MSGAQESCKKSARDKLLLCIALLLFSTGIALMAPAYAYGYASDFTQDEAVAYLNSLVGENCCWNDSTTDCVDVAQYYYNWLGVGARSGNGYAYARGNLPSGWIRVYSDPQPGDVAAWDSNHNVSSSYGHVACVVDVGGGRITTVEQSTNKRKKAGHNVPCFYASWSASSPSSYLRPNFRSGSYNSFTYAIDSPSGNPTVDGNLVAWGWARIGDTPPNKVVCQPNGPGTREYEAGLYSRPDVPDRCAWRVEIPASEFYEGSNHVAFAADFDDGRHFMETRSFTYDPPDFIYAIDSPIGNPTVDGNLVAWGWARIGDTPPNRVVCQPNGPGTTEYEAGLYSRPDVPGRCAWRVEIPAREFHFGNNHVAFAADFDDGRHFMETRSFTYDPPDSEEPVISNIQVYDITPDGYRVSCKVTDNVGVARVLFPSWTSDNGQDDISWTEGSKSGDTYSFFVKSSNHGGQSGPYNTHIWAYDGKGNIASASAGAGLLVPKAMANLGDSTYFLIDYVDQSHEDAAKLCEWAYGGGHLVDIQSAEEQEIVASLVASGGKNYYWIGASNAESEGNWGWSDGSGLDGYDNWLSGEPNGRTSGCYALVRRSDKKWQSSNGSGHSSCGFIMEVEGFHDRNGAVTTDLAEGVYTVHASGNEEYVLDVDGISMTPKANVMICRTNGGDNQRFKFTLNGDGTYTIVAVHSELALDVFGGALSEDSNVVQYDQNGSAAQRWYLEVTDDGYYSFRSKVNNLYLDIANNALADSVNIRTHSGNASAAQKFTLNRADDPKVTKAELLEVTPNGYKVRVEVDAPRGIKEIRFPSWIVSGEGSKAVWGTAPVTDNTAEYEVEISEFGNRRGVFYTDVYVTDSFGKEHYVKTFNDIVVPSAIASWSNSTYFLVDDMRTVGSARQVASSQRYTKGTGAHLAVIESADEQSAIGNLIKQGECSYYWIGASDAEQEGQWVWDTGSALSYHNWAEAELDGGTGENSAAIDKMTGEWGDHRDSVFNGYIIEYEGDDRVGPEVSDVSAESVDETGYTLRFKASDPSGIYSTRVYAWAEAEGDDRGISRSPISLEDGYYCYRVNTSDHGGAGGVYHAKVIATDSLGNESTVDLGEDGTALVPDAAVDAGDAVFYRFDQSMTWTEAQEYVSSKLAEGMQLGSVLSEADDDYLASLLAGGKKSAYWIGLSDASASGTFTWTDGSSLDYTRWAFGQPSSSSSARYAAVLASNQKWYAYGDAGVGGNTANMGFIVKLAYVDEGDELCSGEHTWGDWETIAAATCSKAGLEVRFCEKCGYSESRDVAKLAHTALPAVHENEHVATCAVAGSYDEVVYCSVCGEEVSRTAKRTAKLDHQWSEGTVTTEPTCEAAGVRTFTCSACGGTKTEPIAAVGHVPGAPVAEKETSASTCTEGGSFDEVVYCSACGEELSRERKTTEPGAHTAVTDPAVAPTCTEAGLTEGSHCVVCGEVLAAQEVVPALGHDAEAVAAVAPTCTEAGATAGMRCKRCGEVLSGCEPVSALGHDYVSTVVAPTCTEGGHTDHECSRCGDSYVDAATSASGHVPGQPTRDNEHAATCTQDGSHDLVTRCAACGAELSRTTVADRAFGHIWGNEDVIVEATCTTNGARTLTCLACGQTKAEVISATGHVHTSFASQNEVAATCTEGGSHDSVLRCNDCGAEVSRFHNSTDPLGHDYVVSVVEPTWNEAGYTLHTCSRCDDSYQTDPVASFKEQASQAQAQQAADAIAALPPASELTLSDAEDIGAVRKKYDELTEAQQSTINAAPLEAAEARLTELRKAADAAAVSTVSDTIAALPEVDNLSLSDESKVEAARASYDALTEAQQQQLGTLALRALKAAEAKIAALKVEQSTEPADLSGSKEPSGTSAVNLSNAMVRVSNLTYTGKALSPSVVVKLDGATLTSGADYTVAYQNRKGAAVKPANVKAAGSYKVVVKGKGAYNGTVIRVFKIKKAYISKASFGKIAKQTLVKSGKPVKPKVTVKFKGRKLKKGADYTVTYKKNKKVGKARAIVKGKGNFTGSKTLKFKIIAKKTHSVTAARANSFVAAGF